MKVQVYTVEDVAHALQVHKKTVYDWLETKELIGVYINSEWRVLGEDLYEFLKRHRTDTGKGYQKLHVVKNEHY